MKLIINLEGCFDECRCGLWYDIIVVNDNNNLLLELTVDAECSEEIEEARKTLESFCKENSISEYELGDWVCSWKIGNKGD